MCQPPMPGAALAAYNIGGCRWASNPTPIGMRSGRKTLRYLEYRSSVLLEAK
jgi:hypothetical protein